MAKETISKSKKTFRYGDEADVIIVKGSSNRIYTNGGKDKITLSKGNKNLIDAGTGNDIITVKAGNKHRLQGGTGSDKYILKTAMSKSARYTINQSDYKNKDTDTLQLAKVSKRDVTYGLQNGNMIIKHRTGGKITVSGWDKNKFGKIVFKDGTLKSSQYKNNIYNVVALSKNKTYKGAAKSHEEFAVKFSTKTNIVINSASATADRIAFTNSGGWSCEHDNLYVRGNDLILGNWDAKNSKELSGQITIKNFMKSSVKEIDFSDQTYHLITKTGTWTGSNTYSDRFMILDGVKTGSRPDVGDWNVTLNNIRQNDFIDLRSLPVNSRYYGIRGDLDKTDFVLNYYYTTDNYTEELLGTIRLKNFFKKDGTMNTANGYPRIRINREFYTGEMSDNAFDGLVWQRVRGIDGEPEKNYRRAYLNAGTSKGENVDLGKLTKPNGKMVWMYYAGGGKDTVTSHAGDIVYGGAGDDTLKAQGRMSDIHGGAGNDTITVRAADNKDLDKVNVYGEKGNDTIEAYGSYQYLSGGSGTDTINLYNGSNSFVSGGSDDDIIYIRSGHNHRADGGRGNDDLYAEAGNNHVLAGKAGNDTITINGGNNSVMRGGIGSDTYIINAEFTSDAKQFIEQRDFAAGDTDSLQLTTVNKGDVTFTFNEEKTWLTGSVEGGGKFIVRAWDVNPLDRITFADGSIVTGKEINSQFGLS